MAIVIVSLFIGIALGRRFTVSILLPAMAVALVLTIGAGFALKEDGWSIFWFTVATAIALQLGYLGGAGLRLSAASKAARVASTPAPNSVSTQHPAH